MPSFFTKIYDYFASHRLVMWLSLILLSGIMAIGAINIRFQEDITAFFPESEQNLTKVLGEQTLTSRIAILITSEHISKEPGISDTEYDMIDCADLLSESLINTEAFYQNAKLTAKVDDSKIDSISQFIYEHLPVLLTESDYNKLDSLTSTENIKMKMRSNYDQLSSFMGAYISDFIYRDPLGIATPKLSSLQSMGHNFSYNILDGYVFSEDKSTLLFYIDPKTNNNSKELIRSIESSIQDISSQYPELLIEYFGAPAVAHYNAVQIKRDSMITLNIAILVVVIFIVCAFRSRRNIILLLMPVVFGVLFSLSLAYLIQGNISLIAVGSGSIIFGLAFSYSIHLISHAEHSKDIYSVIKELSYPLTIGSVTTIGAFIGLLFTNSKLLQDFGLFSSLILVGTTLFSLIYLPQFIKVPGTVNNESNEDKNRYKLLNKIDRISGRSYEHNKVLICSIIIFVSICALFFNDVNFNSDLMRLNYTPKHLAKAEEKLNSFSNISTTRSNILFLSSATNQEDAIKAYTSQNCILDSLKNIGEVNSISDISDLIISNENQELRLAKWSNFWTEQKRKEVLMTIRECEDELGFETGSFSEFEKLISYNFNPINYGKMSNIFPEWITVGDSVMTIISQVNIDDAKSNNVYSAFKDNRHIIIADRAHFASLMAEDVKNNFFLVLYISGFLIFSVLLISYGRLELTIIAFMPMLIAWVIIIGLMSIFQIEFNIVTIILSTFIFGIGDDFSIFVMDGLQSEYKSKTGIFSHHKRAIFISAISLIVGMGSLIFAVHPAMYSLGIISLIGMAVVLLVSYTISPMLFRLLITRHTTKGNFPLTILGLLHTIYAFSIFIVGTIIIQLCIILTSFLLFNKHRRELIIHAMVKTFTSFLAKAMFTIKQQKINTENLNFNKPSVIIANHQSIADIILILSLHRKIIMITKDWVWRSPILGPIVRFLGFYNASDGFEDSIERLGEKVKQGYSIMIFPEGTRSADNEIKRFHKGAFYIAEKLKLDITPILFYGNGDISSKSQPLYIKVSDQITKVLERIPYDSQEYGIGYKERCKNIQNLLRREYKVLYEEFNRASNSYFRNAIIANYTYKGPVLEWYMRVKLKFEKWYDSYDRLLPREGIILDLGCGYGAMAYLLSIYSNRRRIIAIDYDGDKIDVANNAFLKNERINFYKEDIRNYNIPQADGIIISDVLHYVDHESQKRIIENCILKLNKGGVILIREGDKSLSKNHELTEKTEQWSTKYIKFNITDGELCFLSKSIITDICKKHNMNFEIIESKKESSNTLFRINHK